MIDSDQPDEDQDQPTEASAEEVGDAGSGDILGKIGGMLPDGALGQMSQMFGGEDGSSPLGNFADLAGQLLKRD